MDLFKATLTRKGGDAADKVPVMTMYTETTRDNAHRDSDLILQVDTTQKRTKLATGPADGMVCLLLLLNQNSQQKSTCSELYSIAVSYCRYGGTTTNTGAPAVLDSGQATGILHRSDFDSCFAVQAPGSYQGGTSKGSADALPQVVQVQPCKERLIVHSILITIHAVASQTQAWGMTITCFAELDAAKAQGGERWQRSGESSN